MDWDAGALAARDFLHDAPDAFLRHTASADVAAHATPLPGMPDCADKPADGMQLRRVRKTRRRA